MLRSYILIYGASSSKVSFSFICFGREKNNESVMFARSGYFYQFKGLII
jgi:hypothetical protein